MAKRVRGPQVRVKYNNRDITRNISSSTISVRYDDSYSGESDTISLTFENRDLRWLKSWFPAKGDLMEVEIRFEGIRLPCGEFEVDTIEVAGPPDRVTLKGIGVKFDSNLREERTESWESVRLSEIVEAVASFAGMGSYIELAEDLELERVEQNRQSSLNFLKELAKEYDVSFKATNNTLYFISTGLLESRPATYIMRRRWCSNYSFRDKSRDIYRGVLLECLDPESGEKREYKEEWDCPRESASYLKVNKPFSSEGEAAALARGLFREHNGKEQTGSISCAGNAKLLSGMILEVKEWGEFDGLYMIEKSSHNVSRSGYSTTVELTKTIS